MSAPQTMAEATSMIDALQADLDRAHRDIETLRAERDEWRAVASL